MIFGFGRPSIHTMMLLKDKKRINYVLTETSNLLNIAINEKLSRFSLKKKFTEKINSMFHFSFEILKNT